MVYADIKEVSLGRYIPYERFRTVTADCRNNPKGISEMSVIIELSKGSKLKFKKDFPQCFTDDFEIFGFLRPNDILKEEIKDIKDNENIVLILNEFDKERFLFMFRQSDGTEEPIFFVKQKDVIELLSKCRNPNL